MVVGIDAAFCVILVVPVVAVASGYVVRCVIVVCYCEMQGVGAGTVVGVDVVECVCTSFGIGAVVPSERITCILIVCIVCAMVDCEIEGVNISAG